MLFDNGRLPDPAHSIISSLSTPPLPVDILVVSGGSLLDPR